MRFRSRGPGSLLDLRHDVRGVVVDGHVGPERLQERVVARRGRGDDFVAGQVGELDREEADGGWSGVVVWFPSRM